jgi:hypothetical protein
MSECFKAMRRTNDPRVFTSIHNNLTYKIGETYQLPMNTPVKLCSSGYHACKIAIHCWSESFGYNYDTDALAIVILHGTSLSNSKITVAERMTFVRILSDDEKHNECSGVLCLNSNTFYAQTIPYSIEPQEWYCKGKLHRDDGPARIYNDGAHWYRHGKRHRDGDLPALIDSFGMCWYINDELHRDDDKPAVIDNMGICWYNHGLVHRDINDMPAKILMCGLVRWYIRDKLKRPSGKPAIVDGWLLKVM